MLFSSSYESFSVAFQVKLGQLESDFFFLPKIPSVLIYNQKQFVRYFRILESETKHTIKMCAGITVCNAKYAQKLDRSAKNFHHHNNGNNQCLLKSPSLRTEIIK